jgi:hypothetical protein
MVLHLSRFMVWQLIARRIARNEKGCQTNADEGGVIAVALCVADLATVRHWLVPTLLALLHED